MSLPALEPRASAALDSGATARGGRWVGYDMVRGERFEPDDSSKPDGDDDPGSDLRAALRAARPARMPPHQDQPPGPSPPGSSTPVGSAPGEGSGGEERESTESGTQPRSRPGSPGSAPREANPDNRPAASEYQLLVRFAVSDTEFFYTCSASPLRPGELATAGHCVYQHDPNRDGKTNDAGWATEVWARPLTSGVNAERKSWGSPTRVARVASRAAWVEKGDAAFNLAIITLAPP